MVRKVCFPMCLFSETAVWFMIKSGVVGFTPKSYERNLSVVYSGQL